MAKDTSNKGAELRAIRDEKGLSRQHAVEFFRKRGYDFSTKSLQNWESGDRKPRDVDLDVLIELLKDYQQEVDFENLEAGHRLRPAPSKPGTGNGFGPDRDAATEYRFFGRNFGTEDKPVPDVAQEVIVVSDRIIRSELGRVPDPSAAYWTRVNGEAMEPFLQDGALVLAEETENGVEAPGRYVLRFNSAGGIVKRCERLGKNALRVASDNRSFPTQVLIHQGGDRYEDGDGHSVRLRVQGRIVYPKDTAHAIKEHVVHDIARAIGETAG